MYNLIIILFQEKVDEMYLPPLGKGKSGCPQTKRVKILQILY